MKSTRNTIKRQHEIGKIFRSLCKKGVDQKTAIKTALAKTQDK